MLNPHGGFYEDFYIRFPENHIASIFRAEKLSEKVSCWFLV
jgi:hypothetical protein